MARRALGRIATGFLAVCWLPAASGQTQAEYEREPILYLTAPVNDPVARLQDRLDRGEATLSFEGDRGYLDAVLEMLGVPKESQVLVFSKTSFQRSRIAPDNPRALYFNDEVYVGFVPGGEVVEVSSVDPAQGAIFYALDQEKAEAPRFQRMTHDCLMCHTGGRTQDVPGHFVRSVYTDRRGNPVFNAASYTTDVTSPFDQRWGGWYVTGTAEGEARHMGNVFAARRDRPEEIDREAGSNVRDLAGRFDTSKVLTPHSDIVSLLVLEHQTQMHNALARANYEGRQALHYQGVMDHSFGNESGELLESVRRRLDNAAERVVKHLLFVGEAPLPGPVRGTSGFAAAFAVKGRRDPQGRSLRDFDLTRRLFTYPCSYLIDSPAFDGLPAPVKQRVAARLDAVLSAELAPKDYAHLSADDRLAIREILRATEPELTADWPTDAACKTSP